MNTFLIIAAGFCFGQIIPYILQPYLLRIKARLKVKRLKPLDCEACTAFWCTLFLCLTETNIKYSILAAIVAFCLAIEYEKKKFL